MTEPGQETYRVDKRLGDEGAWTYVVGNLSSDEAQEVAAVHRRTGWRCRVVQEDACDCS